MDEHSKAFRLTHAWACVFLYLQAVIARPTHRVAHRAAAPADVCRTLPSVELLLNPGSPLELGNDKRVSEAQGHSGSHLLSSSDALGAAVLFLQPGNHILDGVGYTWNRAGETRKSFQFACLWLIALERYER